MVLLSSLFCFAHKKLFVLNLSGSDVVLGFVSKEPSSLELQKIRAMKHTPGSGVLSVRYVHTASWSVCLV